MTAPPHGKLYRHSAIFRTLSRKFSCNALSRFGDLVISDVRILRSQTSNSNLLIAFREVLRCLFPGSTIPGEQRHNQSLSFLRFVPSRAQILPSREWICGDSCTFRWGDSTVGCQSAAGPLPLPLFFGHLPPLPHFLVFPPVRIGVGVLSSSFSVLPGVVIRPVDLFPFDSVFGQWLLFFLFHFLFQI